eukprot:TRINITY_DN1822_c1_g3_i2.p3 TRINITY_DN1822_c1_g3~~TRINITY_DN1822_c1_g3_i2.p3  ORF type:complete len:165 (-),score=22.64 TRINITY_DN1822_c1_g3_i2:849-1343(-)
MDPTVSDERIEVNVWKGSILAAHVINAKTMEKRWPGECAYFLMQASNMMWIRQGAEAVVRQYEYSHIYLNKEPFPRTETHPFTAELSPDSTLFGWEIHEGSFYPMADVIGFYTMLDRHFEAAGTTLDSLVYFPAYFEESWLPTYALNFGSKIHKDKVDEYPQPL